MALARTTLAGDPSVTATVRWSSMATWFYGEGRALPAAFDCPLVATVTLVSFGSVASTVTFWAQLVTQPGMPPHGEIRLYARAMAYPHTAAQGQMGYRVLGVVTQHYAPGVGDYCTVAWSDETPEVEVALSYSGLYLHKMRDTEPMPEFENGPTSPCHPLHLGMKYAWGGSAVGVVADAGIVADSTAGNNLPAQWPQFADLGCVSCGLAFSHEPWPCSGKVAEITSVVFNGEPLDFGGYLKSRAGSHTAGEDDGLGLYVDDYTKVNGADVYAPLVYAPIVIDYQLEGYDWAVNTEVSFRIPANLEGPDGFCETVDGPFTERRAYWWKSWGGPWQRPFALPVRVDPDWAALNGENVEPDDAPCVIEEAGLDCEPENTLDVLTVDREAGLDLLPGGWEADDDLRVTVNPETREARVVVGPGASYGAISHGIATEYFARLDDPETLCLPEDYLNLKAGPGEDVYNLEQFTFLRLAYSSERPVRLTLRLDYSEVTIHDNHLTGSARIEGFSYDRVRRHASWTFDLDTTEGSATRVAIADLCVPMEGPMPPGVGQEGLSPWLQHVDRITLSGFDGWSGGEWLFVLRELSPLQYNPQGGASGDGAGYAASKVVFPRPDEGGLPISLTALTMHADGGRACRPPDQIHALCEEAGIDFVEYLIGSGSGVALHAMRSLQAFADITAMQEGLEVGGIESLAASSAAYQAAFVDADGVDMLGGRLYAGDLVEQYDREIDGSAWPARPRVGMIYPASGVPLPCVVRKHLHGSLHGMVRSGRRRAGPDVPARLVVDDAEVAADETDDWSGVHFLGLPGARELRSAYLVADGGSPSSAYTDLRNQLRRWVEVQGGLARIRADGLASDVATVLAGAGLMLSGRRTHDNFGAELLTDALAEGRSGSVVYMAADGGLPRVLYETDGNLVESRWFGESTVLLSDVRLPEVTARSRRSGRLAIAFWRAGTLYYTEAYLSRGHYVAEADDLAQAIGAADEEWCSLTPLPSGRVACAYRNAGSLGIAYGGLGGFAPQSPLPGWLAEGRWPHLRMGESVLSRSGVAAMVTYHEGGRIALTWLDYLGGELIPDAARHHTVTEDARPAGPAWLDAQGRRLFVWYLDGLGEVTRAESRDGGVTWG
jgi:hypothetical protein